MAKKQDAQGGANDNKTAATGKAAAGKTSQVASAPKAIVMAPPPPKGQRGGGGGRSAFSVPVLCVGVAAYGHITSKKVEVGGQMVKYPNLMDIMNGRVQITWDTTKYKTAQAAFDAEGIGAFSYAEVAGEKLVGYVQNDKLMKHNAKAENADNQAEYAFIGDVTEAKKFDCFVTSTTEANGRKAIENYNNYVNMPQHKGASLPVFTALASWTPLLPEHKLESVQFEAESVEA